MEPLERLIQFIETRRTEYENSLQQWYKESKFYRPATLKDLFGEEIGNDIKCFQETLETGTDVSRYVQIFEDAAVQYGKSWYDEDLGCIRPGYEFESNTYGVLRNIAAQAAHVPEKEIKYFEGYCHKYR